MTMTLPSSASPTSGPMWSSASEVILAAELLYAPSETHSAHDRHRLVRDLVKQASLQFTRQKRPDEAFRLLSVVQIPPDLLDAELFHLRNSLLLHEQKRVARIRKLLKTLLICVLTYLLLIAPTIFITLENPYRASHQMSQLDWSEGLYWSIMTSTTVGYGDIVPQTPYARLLSLFDAILGVTLMGVTAGLILSWVTPRRFD
jgi:hypothetical protein